jgi:hypothetical protein
MEIEKRRTTLVENDVTTTLNVLTKNLNGDILVEIFQHCDDIFESTSAISKFIEAWGKFQELRETLDFSMLKSNFIKSRSEPFVWVNSRCDNILYNLLFVALNLSQGNIKTLIFHYNLYLSNDQFSCIAKRYVILISNSNSYV